VGATPGTILRLVGQIARHTWLQGPDGLYLIDQHAAHERVLFERLMAAHESNSASSFPRQILLQPISVQLPPGSAGLLTEQLPVLIHLGFQVEPFGPGAFLVRSLPALLAHMDPQHEARLRTRRRRDPLRAEVEERIAEVCKRQRSKPSGAFADEQRSLLRI
jgi:DNA mismatch repair protein MutL